MPFHAAQERISSDPLGDLLKELGIAPPARHAVPSLPKNDWSQDNLAAYLHHVARRGCLVQYNPDRIDFGAFARQISALRESIATGRERGRFILSDLRSPDIVMGRTCVGTEGNVMLDSRPPDALLVRYPHTVPTVMIHTHPADAHHSDAVHHFSPQDFKSFLAAPSIVASIVIAPRLSLAVFKSSFTPEVSRDRIDDALLRLEQEYLRPATPTSVKRFTKEACVQFGLTLLRAEVDNPGLFRKVKLFD